MRKTAVIGALVFAAMTLSPAGATTYLYTFSVPTGTLGTSQSYTTNGISITAYGYRSSDNLPLALYGKNGGADETGLGMAKDTVDHEIQTDDYVQMDFSSAQLLLNVTTAQFQMASGLPSQAGEGWKLYGSNTLGVKGTLLVSGMDENLDTISSFLTYKYYSWTAWNQDGSHPLANVLLAEVVLNGTPKVPEPGTFLLAGLSLVGLSLTMRKMCGRG